MKSNKQDNLGVYQSLPTSDKTMDEHILSYKSPFTYADAKKSDAYSTFVDLEDGVEYEEAPQGCILRFLTHFLTVLSYISFAITFPISYFFCVKTLREDERMVVFRLGKMIGAKGPGRILIFPWLDRCIKAVVSDSAFSVPPQQLITNDGGIIEIGAEVQYGITDVVVMVREVADHQDILRSLGKTLLVRILAKKHISKLTREKTTCANEITKEFNKQVRKWGLIIRCVSLSEIKVLKQPEAIPGVGGVGKLLQGLGLTPPTASSGGNANNNTQEQLVFPSPLEFVRNTYSNEDQQPQQKQDTLDVTGLVEAAENGDMEWPACLESIFNLDPGCWDSETFGKYGVTIDDKNVKMKIDISQSGVSISGDSSHEDTCVSVNISSSDLAGILKGSLPPLQAYLTGRITTQGDIRKLMMFEKISNRAHKPGSTFCL